MFSLSNVQLLKTKKQEKPHGTISQWKSMESPETNLCSSGQLTRHKHAGTHGGGGPVSSESGAEETGSPHAKERSGIFVLWHLQESVQDGSKTRMQDLKLKLLEENTGTKQHCSGQRFLTRTSKAHAMKAKIDKWDCVNLRSFCIAKKTIHRLRENIYKPDIR
jgi:hypothetical protein